MNKNIIVFGANGFIGSSVKKHLKELEYNVWSADLQVSSSDKKYISILDNSDNFDEVFQKNLWLACINCAGAASVPLSIENPALDHNLNVELVEKILISIHKHAPSCKFINLSSAAVYGNPISLPINENHSTNPLSPYGCHKLEAEKLCAYYFEKYSIPTASLRIFSAYGVGLKKQIFWDLYQKTLTNENIELFGTGDESRDFIYVNDVANAIECVLKNAKFENDVYNIANGIEIKIRDAAEIFLSLIGFKGKLSFSHKQRQGDPSNWIANIEKINGIGYNKQISFEQGLKMYAAWVKREK